MNKYIESVAEVIEQAVVGDSLGFADGTSGYSGEKLITLLKLSAERFLKAGESAYVEIGVFKGLTLLSIGDHLKKVGLGAKAYGIDNFSQFDQLGENKATVERGISDLAIEDYVQLINLDYEVAMMNLKEHLGDQKIGVFFIDGPHDYRSQLMCLQLALPHLADECLILIDDCNYQHVRLATCDFLTCFPNFKLAFEGYTKCHPKNATPPQEIEFRKTWWDGVNVIVRDTDNLLSPMMPVIGDAKDRCLNDHQLHASKYASGLNYANGILLSAESISSFPGIFNPMNWAKLLVRSQRMFASVSGRDSGLFDSMNTHSEKLPENNANPGLSS